MSRDNFYHIQKSLEDNGQLILFFDGHQYYRVTGMTGKSITITRNGGEDVSLDEVQEHQLLNARPAINVSWSALDPDEKVELYDDSSKTGNAVRRTHPSYGSLSINRTTGQANLFNSEINHQHFISLEISRSEVIEDDTDYRCWPIKSIIQIWMSEVQFARAITSFGSGSGTPCTLKRVHVKPLDDGTGYGVWGEGWDE